MKPLTASSRPAPRHRSERYLAWTHRKHRRRAEAHRVLPLPEPHQQPQQLPRPPSPHVSRHQSGSPQMEPYSASTPTLPRRRAPSIRTRGTCWPSSRARDASSPAPAGISRTTSDDPTPRSAIIGLCRSQCQLPMPELAAKLFRGLGDPTRLEILLVLQAGERRVVDLVNELDSLAGQRLRAPGLPEGLRPDR